mmetsp:Transcript_5419/g.14634  ORF Transcript_5419/g.14634 Transcript_5419/m.14634 type:complete len:214 (-) Transcript_5419:609-1250(-)
MNEVLKAEPNTAKRNQQHNTKLLYCWLWCLLGLWPNFRGINWPDIDLVWFMGNVSLLVRIAGCYSQKTRISAEGHCGHACWIPGDLEQALLVITIPNVDHTIATPGAESAKHRVVGNAVHRVHNFSLVLLNPTMALKSILPSLDFWTQIKELHGHSAFYAAKCIPSTIWVGCNAPRLVLERAFSLLLSSSILKLSGVVDEDKPAGGANDQLVL